MGALSTSFLFPFLHRKSILSYDSPPPPPPPPSPPLKISAIKIEEKHKSTTTTRTNTISRQQIMSSMSVPKPKKRSLLVTIFRMCDNLINNYIDLPLRSCFDARHVLSGNFAPVGELPPTKCEVIQGTLPPCLDGTYIRNGPNPQYFPCGPHHLFDGDGMLHSIRISRGQATFCSRFVKTYKFTLEQYAGYPVIPNVFSGFNSLAASIARIGVFAGRIVTGQINPSSGRGLANTSLAYYGERLYALGESDLPYAVKVGLDGEITTIGRHDFEGKLSVSMTAHPKVDPVTGEAFAFRFSPFSPYLTFFRFDKSGSKQPDVPIFSMKSPSLTHDFAITKTYAVFAEIQIMLNPIDMIRGGSLVGVDFSKVPRIGVLPRYAKDESEMLWFEVEGFNMVHAINAWEEDGGDTVVMVAPNIVPVEHTLERMDLIHSSVEMVKVNLKKGMVLRQTVSAWNLEFGVINPAFVAKKNRYVYAAVGDPLPKIAGIVKLDLSIADGDQRECVVASCMFGPGCYGGEPFFVARESSTEEDDGYVVSYVHDENTGESRFVVMDAKSPSLEIVAAVKLPSRVPYGFHGLFVKESDLLKL